MFLVPEEFELPPISLVSYVELNSQFYLRFSARIQKNGCRFSTAAVCIVETAKVLIGEPVIPTAGVLVFSITD